MKSKKTLALAMASALALTLAACGGGSDNNDPVAETPVVEDPVAGGPDVPEVPEVPPIDVPDELLDCLLYTSPSPRDVEESRMPSSA